VLFLPSDTMLSITVTTPYRYIRWVLQSIRSTVWLLVNTSMHARENMHYLSITISCITIVTLLWFLMCVLFNSFADLWDFLRKMLWRLLETWDLSTILILFDSFFWVPVLISYNTVLINIPVSHFKGTWEAKHYDKQINQSIHCSNFLFWV